MIRQAARAILRGIGLGILGILAVLATAVFAAAVYALWTGLQR